MAEKCTFCDEEARASKITHVGGYHVPESHYSCIYEILEDQKVTAYAGKFIADHSRAVPVNDETLEKAFANCVIPAHKRIYPRIKSKIEEMRA